MTSSTHTDEEYADGAKAHYKILPYGLPLYEEVIRDKVLEDIAQDPLWYIGILGKRLSRLLTEFTPIRLSLLDSWITIPSIGFLFIPMVLFSVVGRRFFETGLLMFTLPTCFTALFIYSGRGTIFYGVFHLIAGALFFASYSAHFRTYGHVSSRASAVPDLIGRCNRKGTAPRLYPAHRSGAYKRHPGVSIVVKTWPAVRLSEVVFSPSDVS